MTWRGLLFPFPVGQSPHESPQMVMTPHHIILCPLVEEKDGRNGVEIHPHGEKAKAQHE
jgi:hypothetical protein